MYGWGQLDHVEPELEGMPALNCPGDPGCPGYVAPNSPAYIKSLQDELTALYTQTQGSAPFVGPRPSATSWLNQNSKTVLIGVGIFVGFIMLAKAGK